MMYAEQSLINHKMWCDCLAQSVAIESMHNDLLRAVNAWQSVFLARRSAALPTLR